MQPGGFNAGARRQVETTGGRCFSCCESSINRLRYRGWSSFRWFLFRSTMEGVEKNGPARLSKAGLASDADYDNVRNRDEDGHPHPGGVGCATDCLQMPHRMPAALARSCRGDRKRRLTGAAVPSCKPRRPERRLSHPLKSRSKHPMRGLVQSSCEISFSGWRRGFFFGLG